MPERTGIRSGGPPAEHIEASAYRVPTDGPEADGTLAWSATEVVVVRIRAGTAVGTGWTYGPAAARTVVEDLLAPVVRGHGVWDVPGRHEEMCRALRNTGRAGVAALALSAVDIALWDLKARLLGVPLAGLLGAVRRDVPVYGSGGFTSYSERRLREQLCGWTERDAIPRVKIKIGEQWGTEEERDLHRVAVAREAIGDRAELYVDANGGYGPGQAVRIGRRLEEAGVTWYEEPVSSDDLAGLHAVRAAVAPDVAAGEYGWDLPGLARLVEAGAVDCLQADVTRCGGITEWLRAAAVARAHQLDISGHCAPHLHAAVAGSVPNLRHLEWFHDHVRIERLLFDGTGRPQGGRLETDPGGSPGHGAVLRTSDAESYRIG